MPETAQSQKIVFLQREFFIAVLRPKSGGTFQETAVRHFIASYTPS